LAPELHTIAVLPSQRLPGAQGAHPTLPLSDEPLGHVLHALWPVSSWYFAAPLHDVQADPSDAPTVPFGQGSQAVMLVEPGKLAFPVGQRAQLFVSRPVAALYRPF
jgi:hypothetical protein